MLNGPHETTVSDYWNFELRIIKDFFLENSKFAILYPMEKPKNSITWITGDRRANTEWNFGLTRINSTYVVYIWPCNVQGHFGVIWWICDY